MKLREMKQIFKSKNAVKAVALVTAATVFATSVNVYTTNQSTGNRIKKKIGEPFKTGLNEGKIFSMEWKIPFNDREKIRKGLSIVNFITTHQSNRVEERLTNEDE